MVHTLKPRDKCGVAAVAARHPVAHDLYFMLQALQHRGQESTGIVTYDGEIHTVKGMGLVAQVFGEDDLNALPGHRGIGHVRYSTAGGSKLENCQPLLVTGKSGGVAIGHNGDITNADEIKAELKEKGWAFVTSADTEVVVRLLVDELGRSPDPVKGMRKVMRRIRGAYSLVMQVGPRVFAVRDPHGIRPLVVGRLDDGHVAASETVALDVLGAEYVRDVEPGEIVELTPDALVGHTTEGGPRPAHCMFEYVYFARPDARVDGTLTYDVRVRLGEQLAKEAPVEADLVVPVPDSGRAHAQGYSQASGIPLVEALMKNRYVWRTFIMPKQRSRETGVRLKLNPVRQHLEGKRVILVDDSIVRGTTTRQLVQLVRNAGAEEVHVRIGCPPITHPCYLGIDFHDRGQLIAADHDQDEIAKIVGADSLRYNSIASLVKAIRMEKEDLCLGCLSGAYPVRIEGERERDQPQLEEFM